VNLVIFVLQMLQQKTKDFRQFSISPGSSLRQGCDMELSLTPGEDASKWRGPPQLRSQITADLTK